MPLTLGVPRLPEDRMSRAATTDNPKGRSLPKVATGIEGLDELTGGGLPRRRPTLVCGSAGSGKALLAMDSSFAARPSSANLASS